MLIDPLAFASCYVYSPRGEGEVCGRSRLLRAVLKEGDRHFLRKFAWRVHERTAARAAFGGLFDEGTVLVPVPGNVSRSDGELWVPERLAANLNGEGLGQRVWPGLGRLWPIRKSATAPAGARPSVADHYASFEVRATSLAPDRILLIDDVITKGRTLLAAAKRLQEAFPCARIQAFAMVRTVGLVGGVKNLLEPCEGRIEWRNEDAWRTP